MLSSVGVVSAAQADGAPPSVVAAGAAAGESGVTVMWLHYEGGAHFSADLCKHIVAFSSSGPITCRVAGKGLSHHAVDGTLDVLPAGVDAHADCDHDAQSLFVAVDPGRLALAAADEGALNVQLAGRLAGKDDALWHLATLLAGECIFGYPRGTLFWNETANRFVAHVAAFHTHGAKSTSGVLDAAMLGLLRDYLMAHLDEPLDVATLARMSGRSQFHFSRLFRRAVGVSPYRYVIHLRVARAVELVRARGLSLAEIAARTGFADQSHLSRWVKRVHGVSLTQLVR